jgi:hypothetical protein
MTHKTITSKGYLQMKILLVRRVIAHFAHYHFGKKKNEKPAKLISGYVEYFFWKNGNNFFWACAKNM